MPSRRAWRIVQAYADQDLSFVDSTTFAVMERVGLHEAFAFDADFRVYRFGAGHESDPTNWRDFVSVLKREQYDPMKLLPRKTQFLTEDDWRMNRNPRFGVLVLGFFGLMAIDRISGLTWDVASYYGFPAAAPSSWQDILLELLIVTLFWGGIMLLPAVLLLVKRAASSRLV